MRWFTGKIIGSLQPVLNLRAINANVENTRTKQGPIISYYKKYKYIENNHIRQTLYFIEALCRLIKAITN